MADHLIEFTHSLKRNDPKQHWAQCKCGQNSGWVGTRAQAEEWRDHHQRFVETVRKALSRRTPGLSDQHKWYMEMAERPDTRPDDRKMWLRLAEELAPRLPSSHDETEQGSLF